MTKESSWCPRQMPKTGLGFSTQTTFLTLSMVVWQSWGSPGPLLMNKPSKSTKGQEKNPMKVGHDKREQTVGGSETIFCSTSGIRSDGETFAVQRMVPGYDGNASSSLSQAADLVVFDAAVHHCDLQTAAGVENSGLLETKEKFFSSNLRRLLPKPPVS